PLPTRRSSDLARTLSTAAVTSASRMMLGSVASLACASRSGVRTNPMHASSASMDGRAINLEWLRSLWHGTSELLFDVPGFELHATVEIHSESGGHIEGLVECHCHCIRERGHGLHDAMIARIEQDRDGGLHAFGGKPHEE